MAAKLRIALIEPSQIVRTGLEASLSSFGAKFQVLWSFSSISHFTSFSDEIDPDIIVVNPALFDQTGAEKVKTAINNPHDARIVAFAYSIISESLKRQFSAVLSIYDTPSEIAMSIERVFQKVIDDNESIQSGHTPHPVEYDLSDREKEVLVSVAKGFTNKEIAGIHNISVHTVISHRKNIVRKTGIKSVSGLTVYSLLNGLIEQ